MNNGDIVFIVVVVLAIFFFSSFALSSIGPQEIGREICLLHNYTLSQTDVGLWPFITSKGVNCNNIEILIDSSGRPHSAFTKEIYFLYEEEVGGY